jgi:UDP-perosamine 4-acetyltransferase
LNNKIVIVGTGGHAKVIIDIIRSSSGYEIVGLVGKDPLLKKTIDIPVIGNDSDLGKMHRNGIDNIFIAIGDNKKRSELTSKAQNIGYNLVNAISRHTYISQTVELGKGIAIMPGVVINPDSCIGDNAIINTGSTIDHDCLISKDVHIAPGCNLAGNVKIGQGVFLGIGSKVIPEISIGSWSRIGAGSVIISNIPDYCVAYGVPATIRKKIAER